jgi:hypothetical protein
MSGNDVFYESNADKREPLTNHTADGGAPQPVFKTLGSLGNPTTGAAIIREVLSSRG